MQAEFRRAWGVVMWVKVEVAVNGGEHVQDLDGAGDVQADTVCRHT